MRWCWIGVLCCLSLQAAVLQEKPRVKKVKAHFAGSKPRPPEEEESEQKPHPKKERKNKWVLSKTYPSTRNRHN